MPSLDGAGTAAMAARSIQHYFPTGSGKRPLLVLDDISFDVPPGAFVSIVGASGCGKSTLLRIFAGLVRPTNGHAELGGRPITDADAHKGMVFQEDAVFPWLTVRQNVEYALRARRTDRSRRGGIAREWIDRVGLTGFEDAYPRQLSGGMRKRVDLARIYASDPEVLLMDEPFGALDAQTRLKLQEELLQLWEQRRKTVLFVTHDLDEAVYLSDLVVVLAARPGRVASIHPIDIPRPRTYETRGTERFRQLTVQLWHEIESLDRTSRSATDPQAPEVVA
ncbi:ABC transporter ATP-binding protein [Nakamurella endophytica]|uniref:ABC transporter ATP-binding protein n=1 Tax=Nakamurella endophytica TaxID=1748367 RepID=A0A917TC00_9ACTN|nr:ABC transporter ATP-binding protein [Nakamurella endophytica]GGM16657.1 ABC transporter ATP-binding protein [Nakamurella endophytica]